MHEGAERHVHAVQQAYILVVLWMLAAYGAFAHVNTPYPVYTAHEQSQIQEYAEAIHYQVKRISEYEGYQTCDAVGSRPLGDLDVTGLKLVDRDDKMLTSIRDVGTSLESLRSSYYTITGEQLKEYLDEWQYLAVRPSSRTAGGETDRKDMQALRDIIAANVSVVVECVDGGGMKLNFRTGAEFCDQLADEHRKIYVGTETENQGTAIDLDFCENGTADAARNGEWPDRLNKNLIESWSGIIVPPNINRQIEHERDMLNVADNYKELMGIVGRGEHESAAFLDVPFSESNYKQKIIDMSGTPTVNVLSDPNFIFNSPLDLHIL